MMEVTRRVNAIVKCVEHIVWSLHAQATIERTDTVLAIGIHVALSAYHLSTLTNLRQLEV